MNDLILDLRYSLRSLAKRPGFTLVAIFTLALAIGASTAMFSIINGVLLQPLPYSEPQQLVQIWAENPHSDIEKGQFGLPEFRDLVEGSDLLKSVGAYAVTGYNLWGGEVPERISTGIGSHGYFSTLRANTALGRLFTPDDEVWGNHRVCVIDYQLWQRRYGSDPDIVGQTLTIDGYPYTVIGVLEDGFVPPAPDSQPGPDLWRAFSFNPNSLQRGNHWLNVIGRMQPGVTPDQLQAELHTLARQVAAEFPDTSTHWTITVVPLKEELTGNLQTTLVVLLGAVGLLLLIGCANVSNLMLARAESRSREMALRTAIGAGRGRLVRQLLTESLILAVAGGILGLLIAYWGTTALVASHAEAIPRMDAIRLDPQVLAFSFLVSLLTAVLLGILPALRTNDLAAQPVLREASKSVSGARGRNRLNMSLVLVEIALSIVLLVGAGLLVQTFRGLINTAPGFAADGVLTLQLSLPWIKYGEAPKKVAFWDELLERTRAMPGVESAAATQKLPIKEITQPDPFYIESRPQPAPGEEPQAERRQVSPDYFETLRIQRIAGRDFEAEDRADAPGVAIVNQTLAELYWPNESPLGQRVSIASPEEGEWLTVVGVVGDVRHAGLDMPAPPEIYTPIAQSSFWTMNLVIRSQSQPERLAAAVRREVLAIDPDQPVYDVMTMQELVSSSLLRRRFALLVFSLFAGVALVMAAIGLYSVMSYSVAQRTQEIGLRMTLGAKAGDVIKMVVREGMRFVVLGVLVGAVLALGLGRLMSGLLHQVRPSDPLTFIAVALLMTLVALVANYLPARRATRVEPTEALRYE